MNHAFDFRSTKRRVKMQKQEYDGSTDILFGCE